MELYGELVCTCLLNCRGRCRSQPFATKERYGCGSAACRYTSARWEVAISPKITVKTVHSAGAMWASTPTTSPCGHLRIRRRFLKKALHPAGRQSRPPLRTDLLQNRSFNETTAAPGVNRERLVLCLYRSVTPRSFLSFSRTAFVTPVVSSSVSVRSSARSSRLNATLFLPGAMPGPR